MSRWTQTWTCTACGHQSIKIVTYAKYSTDPAKERPLTETAKRARCTRCRARGQCTITEHR